MNPYLNVIAQEWMSRADALAQWAYAHLVNRTDVWGAYLATEKRREGGMMFFTAPFPAARGKQFLTRGLLAKHFTGLDGHLISLHATSADKTSRWLGIDIDRHDQDEVSSDSPECNLAAAIAWHDKLLAMGFDPLLMDSNGHGGYHVLIVFSEPVSTAELFRFAKSIIADWERRGLAREPETYPKQVCIEEGHYGNCLRLFGRHHTREHFTRVWSGEPGIQDSWLEGGGAIDRILETRLAAPGMIPRDIPLSVEEKHKAKPTPPSKQRLRVCVDLDGVLARYEGWKGLEFTGAPLPGAVEFTRKLSEIAAVIVYSTRCSVELHRQELKEPTRPASDLAPRLVHGVRYWLEKHGFVFAEVYAGQGKPIASAYIDDRAVVCAPQENPYAYASALQRVKELCSTSRDKPLQAVDDQLKIILEKWPALSQAAKDALVATATGTCQESKAARKAKKKC